MIIDKNLEFADAVAVGALNNTTGNLGDVADLGLTGRDIGTGTPLFLIIQITTAFTSGGSAIVNFQLVSDGVSSPAVDGSQTIHLKTDDFPVANLTLGKTFVIPVPTGIEDVTDYERFLGVQARETGSQALTAGAVNAFLTLDSYGWRAYADAVN